MARLSENQLKGDNADLHTWVYILILYLSQVISCSRLGNYFSIKSECFQENEQNRGGENSFYFS